MSCEFTKFVIADISNSHITKRDGELMTAEYIPFLLADVVGDTGSILFVPEPKVTSAEECATTFRDLGYSEAFIALFLELQKQGIPYVRFDADGSFVKGAPVFEW